jgi:uncharacterized protein
MSVSAAVPTILVMAKAPVPGRVKTRLAAAIGCDAAARVAAAALLDTVAACEQAVGAGRCRLAVDGDLGSAVDAAQLRAALAGWTVVPQSGDSLGDRIAAACGGVAADVVQIGMDTPQVTAALLDRAARLLVDHDAVLGPAEDGGWWLLGLRQPARATAIAAVPMSTPETGALTRQALADAGLSVATAPTLRDVDHVADLHAVAALAPGSRTAAAAAEVLP